MTSTTDPKVFPAPLIERGEREQPGPGTPGTASGTGPEQVGTGEGSKTPGTGREQVREQVRPTALDLFDAALDGADEHLALDACLAWFDLMDAGDPTRMEALLRRMRGRHD